MLSGWLRSMTNPPPILQNKPLKPEKMEEKKVISLGCGPAKGFEVETRSLISRTTKQFCLHLRRVLWYLGIWIRCCFLFVRIFDAAGERNKISSSCESAERCQTLPVQNGIYFKRDFLAKNTLAPNRFTVGSLCCLSRDLQAVWWPGGRLKARALEFCIVLLWPER